MLVVLVVVRDAGAGGGLRRGGAGGSGEQVGEGVAAAFGRWPGVVEAVAAGVAGVGLVVQPAGGDGRGDGAGFEDPPGALPAAAGDDGEVVAFGLLGLGLGAGPLPLQGGLVGRVVLARGDGQGFDQGGPGAAQLERACQMVCVWEVRRSLE